MKKIVKRVVIGIGIIILLLVLISIGFFIRFKAETKGMNVIETGNIVDNIFAVKDSFVNMFLIKDSDKYVAIDAGNSLDNVAGELKKLKINPDQIVAVMLTHTDRDHVAALKLFTNAKVWLSSPEEDMITGKKSKFLFFGNHIYPKKYSLLDDQQIVEIGSLKIQGILTPGHTSGSMCYLLNGKYLFIGDALKIESGKIHEFNHFFNMDSKLARQSIGKIANLPGTEYIFTAHYGYTSDYKNAVKDWKK
jgi:glyoxylase-like metal-dependent hydrolase (beta-lactamase superfamily II)